MRIASVAKAFSGAVALSLVNDRLLSLGDTIGVSLLDLEVGGTATRDESPTMRLDEGARPPDQGPLSVVGAQLIGAGDARAMKTGGMSLRTLAAPKCAQMTGVPKL